MLKLKYILCMAVVLIMAGCYAAGYKMASGWESEVITYEHSDNAVNANAENNAIVKKSTEYVLETFRSGDEPGDRKSVV